MKQTFVCQVCKERLTLTGTPKGIEAAGKLWAQGHRHLLPANDNYSESVGIVRIGDQTITTGPLTFIDAPLDARAER